MPPRAERSPYPLLIQEVTAGKHVWRFVRIGPEWADIVCQNEDGIVLEYDWKRERWFVALADLDGEPQGAIADGKWRSIAASIPEPQPPPPSPHWLGKLR